MRHTHFACQTVSTSPASMFSPQVFCALYSSLLLLTPLVFLLSSHTVFHLTTNRSLISCHLNFFPCISNNTTHLPHCPFSPSLPLLSLTAPSLPHCPFSPSLPLLSLTAPSLPHCPFSPSLPLLSLTAPSLPHCPFSPSLPLLSLTAPSLPHCPFSPSLPLLSLTAPSLPHCPFSPSLPLLSLTAPSLPQHTPRRACIVLRCSECRASVRLQATAQARGTHSCTAGRQQHPATRAATTVGAPIKTSSHQNDLQQELQCGGASKDGTSRPCHLPKHNCTCQHHHHQDHGYD